MTTGMIFLAAGLILCVMAVAGYRRRLVNPTTALLAFGVGIGGVAMGAATLGKLLGLDGQAVAALVLASPVLLFSIGVSVRRFLVAMLGALVGYIGTTVVLTDAVTLQEMFSDNGLSILVRLAFPYAIGFLFGRAADPSEWKPV